MSGWESEWVWGMNMNRWLMTLKWTVCGPKCRVWITLGALWSIASPLCVMPRSVCVRAVSCAMTKRLCCVPCPNCCLYISHRDVCPLCYAMLRSYFILLIVDDEWVMNRRTDHPLIHIILSSISEITRVIISVMMFVCDRRISSCCACNGLSCKVFM